MRQGSVTGDPRVHTDRPVQQQRSTLAGIGDACIALPKAILRSVGMVLSILIQIATPGTWRRTVRAELVRQCYQAGVTALPTILITGVLFGLATVAQALYWLNFVGELGFIGDFLVLVLVREVAPLVVALIVMGRSGMVILVELLELRNHGNLRMLEASGIDPFVYVIVPRVLALSISVFCLCIAFLLTALTAGFVASNAAGLASVTPLDFVEEVLSAMGPQEYALVILKTLSMGFATAYIACTTALTAPAGAEHARALLPRGFVRSLLAVLMISGIVTVLL